MKKISIVVLSLVVLAWLMLFFSSKGILIYSSGPSKKDNGLVSTITCTYFSGTSIFKKEYVHSDGSVIGGMIGRPECPHTEAI